METEKKVTQATPMIQKLNPKQLIREVEYLVLKDKEIIPFTFQVYKNSEIKSFSGEWEVFSIIEGYYLKTLKSGAKSYNTVKFDYCPENIIFRYII